ncbi:hypothetical protein HDU96_005627 [Phlyctochytrium bullatum]|nr:hypothetical protein HDU96_005627 [Phlyctochytrium bullatum]
MIKYLREHHGVALPRADFLISQLTTLPKLQFYHEKGVDDAVALIKQGVDRGLLELDGKLLVPNVDAWRYISQTGWAVPIDHRSILFAASKKDTELIRLVRTLNATTATLEFEDTFTLALDSPAEAYTIIPCLRALQETGFATMSDRVIDHAVRRGGDLDLIKFLHYHVAGAGMTIYAMQDVIASGALDVAKLLLENRQEGCDSAAMNSAAANGDLDMARLLLEHGCEVPPHALSTAVRSAKSIEMITFLAARPESDQREAFATAAKFGKLQMVELKVLGDVIAEKEGKEAVWEVVRKALM